MLSPTDFKSCYLEHRVPNPVNITLTQRQVVDGQWITDTLSRQNFRHFANKQNTKCLGTKFKHYGQELSMLVVREQDQTHRHHIPSVIGRPLHIPAPLMRPGPFASKNMFSKQRSRDFALALNYSNFLTP
jgi:hypothetical protein